MRKLVIRPTLEEQQYGAAFGNISGSCQLSAQLWKSALDLVVFWFYSGLLGGRLTIKVLLAILAEELRIIVLGVVIASLGC